MSASQLAVNDPFNRQRYAINNDNENPLSLGGGGEDLRRQREMNEPLLRNEREPPLINNSPLNRSAELG